MWGLEMRISGDMEVFVFVGLGLRMGLLRQLPIGLG